MVAWQNRWHGILVAVVEEGTVYFSLFFSIQLTSPSALLCWLNSISVEQITLEAFDDFSSFPLSILFYFFCVVVCTLHYLFSDSIFFFCTINTCCSDAVAKPKSIYFILMSLSPSLPV